MKDNSKVYVEIKVFRKFFHGKKYFQSTFNFSILEGKWYNRLLKNSSLEKSELRVIS